MYRTMPLTLQGTSHPPSPGPAVVPFLPPRPPDRNPAIPLEPGAVNRVTAAPLPLALLLPALLATACGGEDRTPVPPDRDERVAIPEPGFPVVRDSVVIAGPRDAWPTHGGNVANQRFSPLAQITRGNVGELIPVWIRGTGLEGAFEATPIVVGNTMYVSTARGQVLALNAATGEELWRYRPELGTVTLCCGPRNRGVSAYGEAVYVASLDAGLVALDAETGEPRWRRQLADPAAGYSATMAPLAVDGKVFVGVTGEQYGIRGFLAAFDADSGEELWRWHTIPTPDEEGWWGDWSGADPFGMPLGRDREAERADSVATSGSWAVGGGGIATTPAFDRTTGYLYVNVEAPAPLVDGSVRPGDNLYTGSIVALDSETGERVWHAQYLPHDRWGLSGGSAPFLFDRGGERYVGFAGRTGWVYVFSAEDGAPILRSDNFVPQEGLFTPPAAEGGTRVAPGARGGNPGTGVAYEASTGIAYLGGVHQPMVYTPEPEPYSQGQLWLGGQVRFPPGEEHFGTITAIDLGDGEIVWQKRTPAPVYSDALATAGELVFVGQGSGTLDALDARTGDLLWQFQTGAGVHGGPITYRVAGVQYVAVPAGGSRRFGTGLGDDLLVFALASERPARTTDAYARPDYRRGGPRMAGQGGVRQVDRDSLRQTRNDTPSVGDSPDRPARQDAPAAEDGSAEGSSVDANPGRR